jgi:hypothetical protein
MNDNKSRGSGDRDSLLSLMGDVVATLPVNWSQNAALVHSLALLSDRIELVANALTVEGIETQLRRHKWLPGNGTRTGGCTCGVSRLSTEDRWEKHRATALFLSLIYLQTQSR